MGGFGGMDSVTQKALRLTAYAVADRVEVMQKWCLKRLSPTLMFRVRDGKAVEAWNSIDFFKMFQQMGVVTIKGG